MALLLFQDVLGELDHVGRHLDARNFVEIVVLVAHFVLVAQRGRQRYPCRAARSINSRSRRCVTTRPSPTMPFFFIASRMTANASSATSPSGTM